MKVVTNLFHWIIILSLLLPNQVFANKTSPAENQLNEIELLPDDSKKDAYENLATRFLENLSQLVQSHSPYREKASLDEVEIEKRISEISNILEVINLADLKSPAAIKEMELLKETKEELKGAKYLLPFQLFVSMQLLIFLSYEALTFRFPFPFLIPKSTGETIFNSVFLTSILALTCFTIFAVRYRFGSLSNPKSYASEIKSSQENLKSQEIKLSEIEKETMIREEYFWKKIFAAFPVLFKEPEKIILELEKTLAMQMHWPKENVLKKMTEKVRVAIESSSCENNLTVGTDAAKAIEDAKLRLEKNIEEEFLSEQDALPRTKVLFTRPSTSTQ